MTMDIDAVDHLELYVEDADRVASQLSDAWGFRIQGHGGPETGLAGCRSLLLRQRGITLLVTSALGDQHPAAEYVRRHGDGVAVIAMTVSDAHRAFAAAVDRGAVPVAPPAMLEQGGARVTFAAVDGFGDVTHRFVTRDAAGGPFSPGVIEEAAPGPAGDSLLDEVDHIAVCVPAGELDRTVQRYREVFGFAQTFEERILVGAQAMDSKVVQSRSGKVTLTILEPDTSRAPGQIDEFIGAHGGAGVQHVAFRAGDICAAVRAIAGRGVRFLSTPGSYYDALPERLGPVDVPMERLRELNILADRDRWGMMLQIFAESRHPRRTFFYEVIERRGARSFGSNNIKALYEAVDRQAAARPTLRG
jgi:4-hydroxymandelate synthase